MSSIDQLIDLVKTNDHERVGALLRSNPGLLNQKDSVSSTKVAHFISQFNRTSMNRREKNMSEFGKNNLAYYF